MLFRICAVLCNFYPRPPRGGRPVCFAAGRVSVSISIHALREEGDAFGSRPPSITKYFYPRPPRGGRPGYCIHLGDDGKISIHALREEGDQRSGACWLTPAYFYPRPPRGGRRYVAHQPDRRMLISIHALREEGDAALKALCGISANFYPRPPRGGRLADHSAYLAGAIFLSTPSARRATAKTETKSLFSNKLYNILHEFRRALIYNGSKSYPNHAK